MTPSPASVPLDELDGFLRAVLIAVGACEGTVDGAARAMMHGARFGVDSHGVRLLPHYVAALEGGRVARRPQLCFASETAAAALLDADDAHGAFAAYRAMEKAIALADAAGVGCVSIRRTSHFGPAGAFALEAARAGMVGFVTCNSDAFVRLHDGAARFHGTNPLAWAAPTSGRPWFFDMATSTVPYNRVMLKRSLGEPLPDGAASDADGADTRDADLADMLAPLGAGFGFKGAGLAGVATILSSVLAGMAPDPEIAPMAGPDMATPRGLGAFCMALKPDAFGGRDAFVRGIDRYLALLRRSRRRTGGVVLAPGDREWAEADRRARQGAPVDLETAQGFLGLADRFALAPPSGLARSIARTAHLTD